MNARLASRVQRISALFCGAARRTRPAARGWLALLFVLTITAPAFAPPLGNFTSNHFARLAIGAELSFTTGALPAGAAQSKDRLAALIGAPELPPAVMLLALLIAAGLGCLHALSPGHGKTIVGAYLVGSRGTARHAACLGLSVTITHTVGVFALGAVTLFASQDVVPERLFPILSFVSGAIIVVLGVTLFVRRLRSALTKRRHRAAHVHGAAHAHEHGHDHGHAGEHSHLPPEADGAPITWRSLLAFGVSGGIVPCPSALVVLLSAIALHRVAFGLLLITAFSVGLAGVLTAVGLAFVYAGRAIQRPLRSAAWVRVLPVCSAVVITCAGGFICYAALVQAGLDVRAVLAGISGPSGWVTSSSVLGLGLVFGVKHSLEADHLAAVSTIVSQRKSILSSSVVGALWGVGHTISLLLAGVAVIILHLKIGARTAAALELMVALMLVGLGANALRTVRRGATMHAHVHEHGGLVHLHPHVHERGVETAVGTHHRLRFSARPLLVGMVHGLAGSAALMLLVLSTIPSPLLGFAYITVFGIGSVGGMLVVSALVSVPVHFTAARWARAHVALRAVAGSVSLGLGLLMIYEIGVVGGLLL